MLMSGVVKLTSGDDSWWNLTALDYHYETQPLPTILGWWAHQGPEWFLKVSTFFVLFVETVVPFFIWAPRRLRHIACALLILLQILIGLTGNYCFFNLLTIALCLLLIDDAAFRGLEGRAPARPSVASPEFRPPLEEAALQTLGPGSTCLRVSSAQAESPLTILGYARRVAAIGALIIFVPLNTMLIVSAFQPSVAWPRALGKLYGYVEPFRIVNGYGLFRVMTKSRPEIIIEGSADGVEWLPYEFKWKPGDLNQPPHWVAPHQPRLDWQMWFAALGTYRQNPWFVGLTKQLLTNNPDVSHLLARNPFPDRPPLFVRSTLFDYHFTTPAGRRLSGAWWKREERGEHLSSPFVERLQKRLDFPGDEQVRNESHRRCC